MQQPRVKRFSAAPWVKHTTTIQIALKGHIKYMAQSLAEINIHLISSTQFRHAFLNGHIRPDLFFYMAAFAWQNGYGVFSVSSSKIAEVRRYIREQKNTISKILFKMRFVYF